MTPTEIGRIAALRSTLWEQGYAPVALATETGCPTDIAWQNGARSGFYATAWPADSRAGTAITTDGLCVVAIIASDAQTAARIEMQVVAIIGQSPRCWHGVGRAARVYRAAEGDLRKRVLAGEWGMIETLGAGNWITLDAVHPDGGRYRANHLPVRAGLTAVSDDQISALFAAVAAEMGGAELVIEAPATAA